MEIKTSEGKFTITEVDFLFYSPYKATAPSNLRVSTRGWRNFILKIDFLLDLTSDESTPLRSRKLHKLIKLNFAKYPSSQVTWVQVILIRIFARRPRTPICCLIYGITFGAKRGHWRRRVFFWKSAGNVNGTRFSLATKKLSWKPTWNLKGNFRCFSQLFASAIV